MTCELSPVALTTGAEDASARAAGGAWLAAMALFTATWVVLGFLNESSLFVKTFFGSSFGCAWPAFVLVSIARAAACAGAS